MPLPPLFGEYRGLLEDVLDAQTMDDAIGSDAVVDPIKADKNADSVTVDLLRPLIRVKAPGLTGTGQ